jgi:F-type H+-transporting ATPase subunit a
MQFFKGILFIFLLLLFPLLTKAAEEHSPAEAGEEFNASSFILEHIADSHEWHILTRKNGEHVALYLPVIVYSRGNGIDVFSSKRLAHGHE